MRGTVSADTSLLTGQRRFPRSSRRWAEDVQVLKDVNEAMRMIEGEFGERWPAGSVFWLLLEECAERLGLAMPRRAKP
jgi:hypothetical protein